ncbi:MAG: hypothetical protein AABY22_16005 [Nanoarchaeota archaeon]
MSRAALLSTCGDIFITSLVLKLWKERWKDEISHFYININNHSNVPTDVISEFISKIITNPRITLIWHPTGIGNGPPQTELVKICNEDLILLLEDDFFIFQPGVVDGYFKKIESGECDLLGSPRYTYGEVADAAKVKYNLDYSGSGDKGFGWWPTGFYCKKADLLKTDLDFGSKEYKAGEYFKELDHTFKETCYTDTFTWTSIQLRYLGLKSLEIPQYHASPLEAYEYEDKILKWSNGNPKYIHGGSLSSGWSGYLSGQVPDLSNENAIYEIETRVAFWFLASDVIDGFQDFKKEYKQGIEDLVVRGNLDRNRIEKKIRIYKELLNV